MNPSERQSHPHQETQSTHILEEKPSAIPPQYKGLPSEVVEELWQNPIYIDEAKNVEESHRRQAALEEIRAAENERETKKNTQLKEQYSALPDEQKAMFPNAQKDAARILTECIQGKKDIDNLSPEESFVIDKLRIAYEDFKKESTDKPFAFDFAKNLDRSIFNNLAQRLSFNALENKRAVYDQQHANAIREKIGIPKHEFQGDSPTTPEKTAQQNYEGLEDKDFEEFRFKNGETDTGVFWYEYGNAAAKKLKESGQLEWGKERIYFDIPLSNMEELRDLAFEIAKNEKIPIAFKHLDVQKTHQINLKPDSETTRFVANFASAEDAKRFYQALQQRDEYKKIKSDRNVDYNGYNIDGIANYASGYREMRSALKDKIESAKLNPDGTFSYTAMVEDYDGKKKPVQKTMTKEMLDLFKKQYSQLPDSEDVWKKINT